MGKKLTYEEVRKYFEDNGCELLESEYINNSTKMKYKCACGSNSEIHFNSFKSGRRCKSCGTAKMRNSIRTSELEVKSLFNKYGCELLGEYKNCTTPVEYKCKCNNISKIRVKDFRKSKQCKKCSLKSRSINRSHTHEFIFNEFKLNGCELLSKYEDCMKKVKYKCICGTISEITYNNFKKGVRCMECKKTKLSKLYQKNQIDIEEFFLKNNCELLDNYKNNNTPMKYKCSCGNISRINYGAFRVGVRCKKCGLQKMSDRMMGSNNPMYKNDRTEIKSIKLLRLRSSPIIKKYRKTHNINTNEYHVDHIFPIYAFVEHKIYDLDIINSDDNLQILTKIENCSKKNKYNKDEFYKWLETKGVTIKC